MIPLITKCNQQEKRRNRTPEDAIIPGMHCTLAGVWDSSELGRVRVSYVPSYLPSIRS